jgi:omega-amidase
MRFSRHPLALLLSSNIATAFVIRNISRSRQFTTAAITTHANSNKNSKNNSLTTTTTTTSMKAVVAKVALCQFPVGHDKAVNHQTASSYLTRAAEQGATLAVLPEIWNGPYATAAFADYAEVLPSVGATIEDCDLSLKSSPSVKLLQDHAQKLKMTIVGGSIPEIDGGKIYNTCLVFDKSGTVVAKHRKVHLFDIDVPGGIRFKESDTLSPGDSVTAFDGGDEFGMIGIGIW